MLESQWETKKKEGKKKENRNIRQKKVFFIHFAFHFDFDDEYKTHSTIFGQFKIIDLYEEFEFDFERNIFHLTFESFLFYF